MTGPLEVDGVPRWMARLAYSAVLNDPASMERLGGNHLDARSLARVVLEGIAEHVAAKDARIAELVGQVARLQAEADGSAEHADTEFDRSDDAASGQDNL